MPSKSTAAAGRPTREAAEKLLANILEAARVEFLDKGLEGANIEHIASVAGCSKLTIYRRFGNRNELFMALVKLRAPDYAQQFHVDTSQGPEQVLYQLGLRIAAFFFEPDNLKFLRLLVAEMGRVEGLPELMRSEADRFREPVRSCLEVLKANGQVRFEDATMAAIQFINLCVLGHYYMLGGYRSDQVPLAHQEKMVRAAVDLFVSTQPPAMDKPPAS
jgi:TetR/AcrR family transcriptional repressor of mexJK operon